MPSRLYRRRRRVREFVVAGLLEGLNGADRSRRLRVLLQLAEHGTSVAVLTEATRRGQLGHLLLDDSRPRPPQAAPRDPLMRSIRSLLAEPMGTGPRRSRERHECRPGRSPANVNPPRARRPDLHGTEADSYTRPKRHNNRRATLVLTFSTNRAMTLQQS